MASRRRVSCALGILGALAGPAAGAPAAAAEPRALVAFLPAGAGRDLGLLAELAAAGLSVGLVSPVTGGFEPAQMAIDVGQGTRVPIRLYDRDLPRLGLAAGRIAGWPKVLERARAAPGTLAPGLLATTLARSGRRVAYVGPRDPFAPERVRSTGGPPATAALAAADRAGRVERAARLGEALAPGRVVLADVPSVAAVRSALAAPDTLVVVVQRPAGERLRLLPAGMAVTGPGGPARRPAGAPALRSATTRRDGLVAATDIAPTVLRHMGVPVPDDMQGRRIEAAGTGDAPAVAALARRLEAVPARRGPALVAFAALWVALVALAALARSRAMAAGGGRAGAGSGLATVARLGLLAVLWLPPAALLAAWLRPPAGTEAALLALVPFALAAATDRLAPWPAGPWVPAAVSAVAHIADLARGSPLIGEAVTGPSPAGGARFFGVGNELETLLALTVLLGTAALLARRPAAGAGRRPSDPLVFAGAGTVAAIALGAGRLGADVGAVIMLGAGTAAAVVAARPERPSRRAVGVAAAVPVAGLAVLVAIDVATGGDAHLSRSVLGAGGPEEVGDVAERRVRGSLAGLGTPGGVAATVVAVAFLVWMAAARARIAAPGAWRAGLVGGWFAVVAGALGNDSGPLILWIGAAVLALALLHLAHPRLEAGGSRG